METTLVLDRRINATVIAVETAIAIAASTRLGQVLTLLITCGFFLLGLLSDWIFARPAAAIMAAATKNMPAPEDGAEAVPVVLEGGERIQYALLNFGHMITPNFQIFWLADAVNQDIWDIGNIAFEAERAQTLDFSHPYVVIEANFLVRHDDDFLTNDDVDRAGTKIAVSERSAYDLWLTDHFSQAQIIRAASIQAAHDLFFEEKVDVLASLKPKLLEDLANYSGLRMIDPPFTAIKQSIGVAKGKADSIAFLNALIAQSIENGWIAAQLEVHGMTGKLGIDPN